MTDFFERLDKTPTPGGAGAPLATHSKPLNRLPAAQAVVDRTLSPGTASVLAMRVPPSRL